MEAILQWVRTSWTKQSRGGVQAARRNTVPTGFRLPNIVPPFVHEIVMHEMDDFQPRFVVSEGLPDTSHDAGVDLREADGLLRVFPTVTPFGMPRRWRRPPAVRLARGEWLRWQINYRFATAYSGSWTYRLDTLNVAHGPTTTGLFLNTPTRHVDERATLR